MTGLVGLDPGTAASRLLAEHDDNWLVQLTGELDRRSRGRRLERIMRVWQLSRTELGALFGVSRQAVSKWVTGGAPTDRAPQIADVGAITDLLEHYLKHDRIPAVVRRQAPGLGGASLIELVTNGQSSDALDLTRRMFAFSDAHT